MNICILADRIPPEGRGGGERAAWQDACALAQAGHTVSVIATTARLVQGVEEQVVDGVHIFYIHSAYHERWRAWRSLYNPSCVGAVRAILARVRPDIVHAHNIHFHLSYHSLYLAKKSGAKVFLTAHDVMLFHYGKLLEFIDPAHPVCTKEWDYHVSVWQKIKRFRWRYNPLRQTIIRFYLRSVDTLFSVSDALRQALVQNGMPNSTVLYTGISLADWDVRPEVVSAFRAHHALDGRLVILFGGRITATKGGEVMLAALAEAVKTEPRALLLIAGVRDAYVERLEQKAHVLGIQDNIVCTGWLDGDALRAAYHAADVVVMPSVCFDTFGLVLLEAFACSKPVIASCFGGAVEIVRDTENGYIINPYDIPAFTSALMKLLADESKRIRFGAAGRARVEQHFSCAQHVAVLEKHYQDNLSV